jgi:hypothetical protein
MLAQTTKYCHDHGFEHWFWTLTDKGTIVLKIGSLSLYETINFDDADPRIFKMLADPKLHPVMKGDILRFYIDYLYGGFYADLDVVILNIQESFLSMHYVCGYERSRGNAGREHEEFTFGPEKRPRQQDVVCTGFFGAPPKSEVNKAVIDFILTMYDDIVRTQRYPKNMWNVLDFTGPDMYIRILKQFSEVKPFPMEYFFPFPYPSTVSPFTIHYYAGTEPGGWTFDLCKNEDCPTCKERATCKISREGRR